MKKVKIPLIMLLTVLLICSCAAVTTEVEETPEPDFLPALDVNTSAELTVMGAHADFAALETAFREFGEYYPNIRLRYVKLDDYYGSISSILEGESAPDIFFAYADMLGQGMYRSVFEHAEDLSDPALGLGLDCVRPELMSYDGKRLPMVPVLGTTFGMLVNEKLFSEAGRSVPESYLDLKEAAAALKASGVDAPLVGYAGSGRTSAFYIAACAAVSASAEKGGTLTGEGLRPVFERVRLTGEGLRPVFERVRDLISSGTFSLDASAELMDNHSALIERFLEGKTPMLVCTADVVAGMRLYPEPDFPYSFRPLPIGDGRAAPDLAAVQLAVNSGSGDLAAANEFMRFLIRERPLLDLAERTRLVPVTISGTSEGLFAAFAEIGVTAAQAGLTEEAADRLSVLARSVALGEISVNEAVNTYNK